MGRKAACYSTTDTVGFFRVVSRCCRYPFCITSHAMVIGACRGFQRKPPSNRCNILVLRRRYRGKPERSFVTITDFMAEARNKHLLTTSRSIERYSCATLLSMLLFKLFCVELASKGNLADEVSSSVESCTQFHNVGNITSRRYI
jgi:hypothetical protein